MDPEATKQIQEDFKGMEDAFYQVLIDISNKAGTPITEERLTKWRIQAGLLAKALFIATTHEATRVCASLKDTMVEGFKGLDERLKKLEPKNE